MFVQTLNFKNEFMTFFLHAKMEILTWFVKWKKMEAAFAFCYFLIL